MEWKVTSEEWRPTARSIYHSRISECDVYISTTELAYKYTTRYSISLQFLFPFRVRRRFSLAEAPWRSRFYSFFTRILDLLLPFQRKDGGLNRSTSFLPTAMLEPMEARRLALISEIIAGAHGRGSPTTWTTSRAWDSQPYGYRLSQRTYQSSPMKERLTMDSGHNRSTKSTRILGPQRT